MRDPDLVSGLDHMKLVADIGLLTISNSVAQRKWQIWLSVVLAKIAEA
jgi:hypothetical protein